MCMTIRLCLTLAVWLTSGNTWSWLEWLPLASGLCSVLYLLVIAAKKQTEKKSEAKGKTLLISESASEFWKRVRNKNSGGRASCATSLWFALFCFVLGGYGISKLPKPNVVTEHDVAIIRQDESGDFLYVSREQPGGDVFRVCPDDKLGGVDTAALLRQGVGYIAEHAIWEEHGICKSILKPEWGFWFKDKENNFTYREITHARTTEQMDQGAVATGNDQRPSSRQR